VTQITACLQRRGHDGPALDLVDVVVLKSRERTMDLDNHPAARELRDDQLDEATGGIVVVSIIAILIGLLIPKVSPVRAQPEN
jgi:hypothetical protein